jgi:hypothetical protein
MSEPLKLDLAGGKTIYALTQVPAAFCIGGQTLIGYPGTHTESNSSDWHTAVAGQTMGYVWTMLRLLLCRIDAACELAS